MEKDVRYTEKKVDESWKQNVCREKGDSAAETHPKSASAFTTFLTSLGYQALIHLGEVPHPETRDHQVDLEAAKETIDLLMLLASKTRGNLDSTEEKMFESLLPELQRKFAAKVEGR